MSKDYSAAVLVSANDGGVDQLHVLDHSKQHRPPDSISQLLLTVDWEIQNKHSVKRLPPELNILLIGRIRSFRFPVLE